MRLYLIYFLIFIFLDLNPCKAQDANKDLKLIVLYDLSIIDSSKSHSEIAHKNITLLKFKKEGIISNYNPVALIFKGALSVYQAVISPQLYGRCIYNLSCSNFSKVAIHEFGLIKGVIISADRLMRCNSKARRESPLYLFNPDTKKIIDHPSKYRF